MATFERRRQVRLLARFGATRRQLARMFGWQALFVTVVATVAALATGTIMASLRAMSRSGT